MAIKLQGKKLSKRTNSRDAFKKFVASGYTDMSLFAKACKGSEDLLIYTCLKPEELQECLNKVKDIEDPDQQLKYLKNNQPTMNSTEERFKVCTSSIAAYLKNYIAYNGFIMNNSSGDADDWASEFWLKYAKICKFYSDRWFHKEKLKKESTVKYNPMLYKEFIYICRMSITGERRHQAFLATQKPEASLFKASLDFRLDTKKDNEKYLMDVVKDPITDIDLTMSNTNILEIKKKALSLVREYEPETTPYIKQIKRFYENEDASKLNKKAIILGKIFLYKAGLRSPKVLMFIKSLSTTYKARYNISNALVVKQLGEMKNKKVHKVPSYADILEDGGKTRVGLILRKRGTTE